MENPKKTVTVASALALMAEEEVTRYVDSKTLESIKGVDPHPVFVMMSVGYEGESSGQLYSDLTTGKKLTKWFKQLWPIKAVNQLVALMRSKDHPPVFENHDFTNANRFVVGNIVASAKKIMKGVTHAIAVAYINNWGTRERLKNGYFNGCSLEVECVLREADNSYNYVVDEVTKFNGVALLNKEENPPGFKDSDILAVVAAMSEQRKVTLMAEGDKQINLRDVQEYVKEHGVPADRLFAVEELLKLPAVVSAFETKLDEKMKAVLEENKVLKKELEPYKKMAAKQKIAEHIRKSELLKDEYKEVVDYLVETLNPDVSDTDDPQKVVDAAVKHQLEIMKKANFRLKSTEKKSEREAHDDDKELTADSSKMDYEYETVDKEDMTLRQNNPLIPA